MHINIIFLIILFQPFFSLKAAVSFEEYLTVKSALEKAFHVINKNEEDSFSVNEKVEGVDENYWWDIPLVHASYVRKASESSSAIHNIYLMGGFARLDYMTLDSLALTGCHEMGHGIGGAPKKELSIYSDYSSSMEGQADYFATNICLPIVLGFLETERTVGYTEEELGFISKLCLRQKHHSEKNCIRYFKALRANIEYFEFNGEHSSYSGVAQEIALSLNYSPNYYPTAQCRINTMIHGILKMQRPQCWFPSGQNNGSFLNLLD